jgi:hypothetical protein
MGAGSASFGLAAAQPPEPEDAQGAEEGTGGEDRIPDQMIGPIGAGTEFKVVRTLTGLDDADNLRFDPHTKLACPG